MQLDVVSESAPAIGDLDADGRRDVVIGGALVDESNGTCLARKVYALDATGSPLPGWPVTIPLTIGWCQINTPPILVDIDGDGRLDVVVKYSDAIGAFHHDGTAVAGFPIPLSDDGQGSASAPGPAAADTDSDGDLELAFASSSGRVAFFSGGSVTSRRTRVWPTYKHDERGTASFGSVGFFVDGFEGGNPSMWSSLSP